MSSTSGVAGERFAAALLQRISLAAHTWACLPSSVGHAGITDAPTRAGARCTSLMFSKWL